MHVKDVRNAQQLGRLKHRAAVQPKPLPVVRIIAFAGPVEPLPVKQVGAIHKVDLHALALAAVHDAHKAVVVLEGNGDGARRVLPLALKMRTHAGIQRQIDRHLVSQLDQLRRQSPHHVGQSAGLGERYALRSGKNNVHCNLSPDRPRKTTPPRPKHPAKGPVYYAHPTS